MRSLLGIHCLLLLGTELLRLGGIVALTASAVVWAMVWKGKNFRVARRVIDRDLVRRNSRMDAVRGGVLSVLEQQVT